MKPIPILACLLLLAAGPNTISAQAPNPQEQLVLQQLSVAIKEVQTQQTTIAANQAMIDEKIAGVAEAIRVARIYSSRSGN
jgi:hypothetical protein